MSAAGVSHRRMRCGVRREQRGVVLFVALLLLLVLTVLGITLARTQTVEERMARNDDNHQIALQAAEAALRAAEVDLNTYTYGPGQFQCPSLAAGFYYINFAANCPAVSSGIDWSSAASYQNVSIAYDGAALAQLPAGTPAPRYLIEELPQAACPTASLSPLSTTGIDVYRVTAHAWGPDGLGGVTLQTVIRPGC